MEKRLKTALMALCLMLTCLTFAQSGELAPGDSRLQNGEYFDVFEYQGRAGEVLTVSLQSSEFDPYLAILNAANEVILNIDDSTSQDLNVLETITLLADGTYTIVVTSVSAGETGSYVLSIQGALAPGPVVPNNDPPEANVVKGRVVDMQGDPLSNATITIAGYTGTGANVVEHVSTDAQGYYRTPIPSGLYTLRGEAELSIDGQTYYLYLHPADNSCEAAYSESGIVKNFLFKLSGFQTCLNGPDPNNYNSYSGGTVSINYAYPRTLPDDAVVTFTLTPQSPLADGSQGEVLTFTRTVGDITTGYTPLDRTEYLYDIPLSTYQISGTVTLPGGAVQALRFGDYLSDEAATTYTFGFEAVLMWPYGIRVTGIDMYDNNWTP